MKRGLPSVLGMLALLAGAALVGCDGGGGGPTGDVLRALPDVDGTFEYSYLDVGALKSVDKMRENMAPEGDAWAGSGLGRALTLLKITRDEFLNSRAIVTLNVRPANGDRHFAIILLGEPSKLSEFYSRGKEPDFAPKEQDGQKFLKHAQGAFAQVGDKLVLATDEAYMIKLLKRLNGQGEGQALADNAKVKPLLDRMPAAKLVAVSNTDKASIPGKPDVQGESWCMAATELTNERIDGVVLVHFASPDDAKKGEQTVRKTMDENEKAKKLIKSCKASGTLLTIEAGGDREEMEEARS